MVSVFFYRLVVVCGVDVDHEASLDSIATQRHLVVVRREARISLVASDAHAHASSRLTAALRLTQVTRLDGQLQETTLATYIRSFPNASAWELNYS